MYFDVPKVFPPSSQCVPTPCSEYFADVQFDRIRGRVEDFLLRFMVLVIWASSANPSFHSHQSSTQASNLQAHLKLKDKEVVKLTFIAAPLKSSSHARYQNPKMFPIYGFVATPFASKRHITRYPRIHP